MSMLQSLLKEHSLILRRKIEAGKNKLPPLVWKNGKKGDIIILQGYSETWNFFETIGNYLNRLGYRIHIIPELEKNRLPIQDASRVVEKYILQHKLDGVILVAHSKGGLVGKLFLSTSPIASKVTKLITIATPYSGTYLGFLMRYHLLELAPGSRIIRMLKKDKRSDNKIISIYGIFDNLIIPNKNLHWTGGKNIKIPVIGHTNILEAKATQEAIKNILENN